MTWGKNKVVMSSMLQQNVNNFKHYNQWNWVIYYFSLKTSLYIIWVVIVDFFLLFFWGFQLFILFISLICTWMTHLKINTRMNIPSSYSIHKWKLKYIEIAWKICYDALNDLFCVKVMRQNLPWIHPKMDLHKYSLKNNIWKFNEKSQLVRRLIDINLTCRSKKDLQ